jgi:hypothetical protein
MHACVCAPGEGMRRQLQFGRSKGRSDASFVSRTSSGCVLCALDICCPCAALECPKCSPLVFAYARDGWMGVRLSLNCAGPFRTPKSRTLPAEGNIAGGEFRPDLEGAAAMTCLCGGVRSYFNSAASWTGLADKCVLCLLVGVGQTGRRGQVQGAHSAKPRLLSDRMRGHRRSVVAEWAGLTASEFR